MTEYQVTVVREFAGIYCTNGVNHESEIFAADISACICSVSRKALLFDGTG